MLSTFKVNRINKFEYRREWPRNCGLIKSDLLTYSLLLENLWVFYESSISIGGVTYCSRASDSFQLLRIKKWLF